MPSFFRLIQAISSSEGGISGVLYMLHATEPIEQTVPKKKEAYTQFGKDPERPGIYI